VINVRRAQQVICISEVLKGYLMRYGVPALKLQVIPNGVDHHAFAPGDPDKNLQERLALQHRVVIGYIGSFEFFAGVPGFMTMAKAICEADRRVVFFFVGEGTARLEIQHRANALGLQEHFRFIGRVPHDQVPAYLRVMDIVVSPYRHEYLFYNSPMKLLEYMAMGKATVSTALGQIKEVVDDGVNGMLYEPGNYDSMRAKLLELVRTPKLRQQLGINARKTMERNWTWDLQAARLVRVLQQARAS
jgi:glycosyltransferase involved in cell wall biosynthesis